ncbi:MAG TPA: U32 family peptidase [Rhodocyclaceae bacterium]|nr:U32 family peptidase [Rhodocyclaceae bacterium]
MRIVAPISRLTEIAAIAEAGANELYCGVVPREWVGAFKAANTNRRPGGNLASLDELEQAVELAHAHECTLSLVLNAQTYSAERSSAAADIAEAFLAMGGDALIVSDIGLIHALSQQLPAARIHVSSVATCRNASGARLYHDLGARRIILPRDVTIDEATEIAAEVPDMELEAFILNDGCVFEEGACNTIHLPGKLGGPICLDSYAYEYRHRNGRPVSERLADRLAHNDTEYRKWLWYRFSCGFTTTPDGMPYGPCGLCAIPAFLRGRIAAVKIAGREGPTRRKVASVRMVKRVLDASAAGADDTQVCSIAKNLRPSVEHCATGYMCYYPEVVGRSCSQTEA